MMLFSILAVLEPDTSMAFFASFVFTFLDIVYVKICDSCIMFPIILAGWLVVVTPGIGTIRLSTQRPIPPHLIVTIGDVSYAMPGYYNIALSVISGAIGYYHTGGDKHKYILTCAALVVGVLLPFAVRMYRRRLPLDDLPVWRNGIDDLSLLYLFTSILSGTEIFKYCVFPPDSMVHHLLSAVVACTAVVGALLAVTEACLLGCATRAQVLCVAMPLFALALAYPHEV